MRKIQFLLIAIAVYGTAQADNLFLDVPMEKQKEVIDRNFDEYHDVVFSAKPERYRIAMLNNAAMDEDDKIMSINLFDDLLPIPIKNKGLKQTTRGEGSEYGYWIGTIHADKETQTIDMTTGEVSKEVRLNLLVQYLDIDSNEYKNALGLFEFNKNQKTLSRTLGPEFTISPLPPQTKFVYHIISTEIHLYHPTSGWVIYRVRSLQRDPDYVLITEPDPQKQFDVAERSDISSETVAKMEQNEKSYRRYKERVEKERAEKKEKE